MTLNSTLPYQNYPSRLSSRKEQNNIVGLLVLLGMRDLFRSGSGIIWPHQFQEKQKEQSRTLRNFEDGFCMIRVSSDILSGLTPVSQTRVLTTTMDKQDEDAALSEKLEKVNNDICDYIKIKMASNSPAAVKYAQLRLEHLKARKRKLLSIKEPSPEELAELESWTEERERQELLIEKIDDLIQRIENDGSSNS